MNSYNINYTKDLINNMSGGGKGLLIGFSLVTVIAIIFAILFFMNIGGLKDTITGSTTTTTSSATTNVDNTDNSVTVTNE